MNLLTAHVSAATQKMTRRFRAIAAIALLPAVLCFYSCAAQVANENINLDLTGTDNSKAPLIIGGDISHFTGNVMNWPDSTFDKIHALGVTDLRTHDIKALDWDVIFPNWDADPEDANNYHFAAGDSVLKTMSDHGFKILLRLGVSTNAAMRGPIGANPPDINKWTVIANHILDHYTKGWANGFPLNIGFVELWNEPDLSFWTGGQQKFYELAKTALTTLKANHPDLKIGTCGIANIYKNKAFVDGLLAYLSANKVPLDFLSWHVYEQGKGVKIFANFAGIARDLLKKNGYPNAQSLCTEYNAYLPNPYLQTRGAGADIASTMIWAEKNDVDGVFFFPLIDTWGLIRSRATSLDYRTFQPTNMSIVYNQLQAAKAQGMTRVKLQGSSDNTQCIAMKSPDQSKIRIMLATSSPATNFTINAKGLTGRQYKVDWDNLDNSQMAGTKSETVSVKPDGTLSFANQAMGSSFVTVTLSQVQ